MLRVEFKLYFYKYYYLTSLLFISSSNLFGQFSNVPKSNQIDSLSIWIQKATSLNDRELSNSIYYLEKCKELIHQIKTIDYKFNFYKELARHYKIQDNHQLRKKSLFKNLEISLIKKDNSLLFETYTSLGSTYSSLKNVDSSKYFYAKANGLLVDVKDINLKFKFYNSLGYMESKSGNLDLALQYYKRAKELVEDYENNEFQKAKVYNNIGTILFKLQKHDIAVKLLYRSLALSRKTKQHKLITMNLYNISSNLISLNDSINKSLDLLNEALIHSTIIKNEFLKAKIYNNKAVIYEIKEDYRSAIINNKLALEIYKRTKSDRSSSLTLQNLALNYLSKGEFQKAKFIADSTLKFVKKKKITSELLYAYDILYKIDSTRGDFRSALLNYKEFIRLGDSIEQTRNMDKIRELQIEFETLEKEKEIQQLNSANESNTLKLAQNRLQNYILWVTIALSVIIIVSIAYQYSLKKKSNSMLNELNEKIIIKNRTLEEKGDELKIALTEKEVLLKEVYHRVKNNLQLISSMLNLQAENLKNSEIDDFVARNQDRIISMSLVHQILYKGDSMGHINLKDYLKQLLDAIQMSFGENGKKVRFKIFIEEQFYDISTAIPLGLIINELVHNSMKYAFIHTDEGQIKITSKKMESTDRTMISISDNGTGIHAGKSRQGSYGLRIVDLLVRQIKGKISFQNSSGTKINITF